MLKNMELVTKKDKNQLFLLSIIIAIDSTRLQCIQKKLNCTLIKNYYKLFHQTSDDEFYDSDAYGFNINYFIDLTNYS